MPVSSPEKSPPPSAVGASVDPQGRAAAVEQGPASALSLCPMNLGQGIAWVWRSLWIGGAVVGGPTRMLIQRGIQMLNHPDSAGNRIVILSLPERCRQPLPCVYLRPIHCTAVLIRLMLKLLPLVNRVVGN